MQKLLTITTLLILFLTLTISACGKTIIIDDDVADDDSDSAVDESITDDTDSDFSDSEDLDDAGVINDSSDSSDSSDSPVSAPTQTANIIVETPAPGEVLTSPFLVSGQANVFEGAVLIRIRNQDGKIVIPEPGTAGLIVTARSSEVGEFGPFKIKINYQFHATKEGTVEVFSQSAIDGSEINMVEVPVKFD